MSNILIIVFIIDTILRGILFNEIGIKWWKAIIPLFNKYALGKEVQDINSYTNLLYILHLLFRCRNVYFTYI